MKVTLQKCVSMENISHIYISENPIGNIFFLPVPEILYLLALGWDLVSPGKGSTGMC